MDPLMHDSGAGHARGRYLPTNQLISPAGPMGGNRVFHPVHMCTLTIRRLPAIRHIHPYKV